jgi:hypothetical protein
MNCLLIKTYLIIVFMFGEEYKLQCSLLCNSVHTPVAFFLFRSKYFSQHSAAKHRHNVLCSSFTMPLTTSTIFANHSLRMTALEVFETIIYRQVRTTR